MQVVITFLESLKSKLEELLNEISNSNLENDDLVGRLATNTLATAQKLEHDLNSDSADDEYVCQIIEEIHRSINSMTTAANMPKKGVITGDDQRIAEIKKEAEDILTELGCS